MTGIGMGGLGIGTGVGPGGIVSGERGGEAAIKPAAVKTRFRAASGASPPPRMPPPPYSSVALSCSGPDGRSVHSVVWSSSPASWAGYELETRFLPLGHSGNNYDAPLPGDEDGSTATAPKAVRTPLPSHVRNAMEADPPLGLICVDQGDGGGVRDGSSGSSSGGFRGQRRGGSIFGDGDGRARVMSLSLLCLYSRRALYVIRVGYTADASTAAETETVGRILSLVEPLESYLLSLPGATVRSVRPAPQSWHPPAGCTGEGVLNRPGAFAVLVDECGDADGGGGGMGGGEQALVLCHGFADDAEKESSDSQGINFGDAKMAVTVPVRRGYEYLGPIESDPIVDFCFFRAPSSGSIGGNVLQVSQSQSQSPSSSIDLGLFPSLAVLLLSRHGNVWAASPVAFHGTLHPRRSVADAVSYLDGESQRLGRNNPRWRRCVAARKFIGDTFGGGTGAGAGAGRDWYYATARVAAVAAGAAGGVSDGSPTEPTEDATTWPVSVQGPLLTLPNGTDDAGDGSNEYCRVEGSYVALDNFPGSGGCSPLGGIVAARVSGTVGRPHVGWAPTVISLSFAVLPSGASVLPRFAFEGPDDADALNGAMEGLGTAVEQIVLDDDDENNGDTFAVSLLPDTSDTTQIHVVSRRGIVTVRTTAMDVAAENATRASGRSTALVHACSPKPALTSVQMEQGRRKTGARTSAWSCLEIAVAASAGRGGEGPGPSLSAGAGAGAGAVGMWLVGAAVSSDATVGRVLVARLSDGSMEAVDLTAAQYLHEASVLAAEKEEISSSDRASLSLVPLRSDFARFESDRALGAMESLHPLHELITPLLSRVAYGLSRMGKIVGAATKPYEVDAAGLASVLETKSSCERDVVLPLAELRETTSARTRLLEEMRVSQLEQLAALQETAEELRKRLEENTDQCSASRERCEELSGRSAAVLGAARDLVPALTVAEREYTAQLRRYDAKLSLWEEGVKQLGDEAAGACDVMRPGDVTTEGPASPGTGVGAGTSRGTGRNAPSGTCWIRLRADQADMCRDLLRGQEVKLKRAKDKIAPMQCTVEEIAMVTGLKVKTR